MKNSTLTLILLLTVFFQAIAQRDFVTLQQRTTESDVVVEGKVASKTSFWNADRSKILTASRIEVNKIFKGREVTDEVTLLTEGGIVGNDFQFVTHSFQVPENKTGIFFLKGTNPFGVEGLFANSMQSYIGFDYSAGIFSAYDGGQWYTNPKRDIYEKIEKAAGKAYRQIKENEIEASIKKWLEESQQFRVLGDTTIEFSFENIEVISADEMEFDIYVRSNQDGVKFAASNVYIEYSQQAFGSYVVANGKVAASKKTVIEDAVYVLELVDDTAQVVKFEVTSGTDTSSLYPLTNLAEGFIHIILDIENLYQLASLSFEDFSMANESIFYDPSTGQYIGFDKIAVSEPIYPFLAPHIDMIAPNPIPAGTGDILTITGSQFGDVDPLTCTQCRVRFPNGDQTAGQDWVYAFGKDIVTWTENEITLKVPSVTLDPVNRPAMSGNIRVERPANGGGVENSNQVAIHIPYAVLNFRTGTSQFSSIFRFAMSMPVVDGILFQYDEDVPNDLRDEYETSVGIWCNRTDIAWNIALNDIPIASENGADNINAVVMMPGNTFSSAHALAAMVVTGHYTDCGNIAYYFNDIDIKINEGAWDSFDPNWQMKWRNAFLHELGHAHLLTHSKNPSIPQAEEYIMFADQGGFNNMFMQIQNDDETGAETVFPSSANLLGIGGCGGILPITVHPAGNCGGIINDAGERLKPFLFTSVSPNPMKEGDVLILSLSSQNKFDGMVKVVDVTGKEIFTQTIVVNQGNNEFLFTSSLFGSEGIYFITLATGETSVTTKIVKL